MFIKQISVFLENKRGTLREMTSVLGKAGVDLMALSIADTANYGIVRIVVSGVQTEQAISLLRGEGYTVRVTDVLCAKAPDRPDELAKILELIEEAHLSVEYMYSFFRHSDDGVLLIFRLSDQDKGEKLFAENGILMASQEEIDTL